jgi:arginase family enzyme
MNVFAADLDEAAPPCNHAEITALVGATVVYELINLFASKASSLYDLISWRVVNLW